ncbi:hypothetical protein O181_012256 [Austropuccinia psidii MF-1]|uniref:Uncharacterized protein n=1 Tax=Austropuccinia psidii MF-1 TaxID=1389203 RepID=A0A9Q3GM47_9BASI|nr:hypothetical protein [Austropuccinia psidii MF-1]
MMVLTGEWRKNKPTSPKQVSKPISVTSRRNSNLKKKPQAWDKGKGKEPAIAPYRQGFRIHNIQQDAMENVFQLARTPMEMQEREEARLKYKNLSLKFFMEFQLCT